MDRKLFLKYGCNTCLLGAAAILVPGITSCSPAAYNVFKTEAVNNMLQVPLRLFEKTNLQLVRPNGWLYDIAVQKKQDNSFSALLLKCTHMENQLTPEQKGFTCSLHGSRFNAEGNVMKGPAEISLKKYKTHIENNHLVIFI